jgi:hypothetical protein
VRNVDDRLLRLTLSVFLTNVLDKFLNWIQVKPLCVNVVNIIFLDLTTV